MKSRVAVFALALAAALLAVACVVPAVTPTAAPTPTPAPTRTPTATPAATATPAPTAAAGTAQLQWLGHSAFLLTSSQGTKVLIDPPAASIGYAVAPIVVDAVLVTHEHPDHNNVSMATGSPLILRGLSATGWNTIDQRVKDIRIYSISPAVPIYHDNTQGGQRGRNTIFVLEVDGLRLAQLGDLG
ncbi:MAG TPA: MBL fold metallo-hydrolase, partial [Dehalococcoidia bacterium]|nr:MBL fold metallo-hydrolase [Dehalococcoidia bacterium]